MVAAFMIIKILLVSAICVAGDDTIFTNIFIAP